MRCYKVLPSSERTYQVFFSINQEDVWCVEGVDYLTYRSIIGDNNNARSFLFDRVKEGKIDLPDNGIHSIYISENGLNFVPIDESEKTANEESDDVFFVTTDDKSPSNQPQEKCTISGVNASTLHQCNNIRSSSKISRSGKIFKKTGKKASSVWNFFIKLPNGGQCKLCSKIYAAPGNTTNLINHLRRAHEASYENLLVKDKNDYVQETGENNPTTSKFGPTIIEPSNQPRIDQKLSQISSFKNGGTQYDKITNALVFMIVKDEMPFIATEKVGLMMVLKEACPHFQIPGRHAMTKLIESKAEVLFLLMKKKLESVADLSMTADIWTETKTSRSFLGCTAHYLNNDQLSSIVLDLVEIKESHTALEISKALTFILEKWNIPLTKITAVVTDNGPNIVKAVNDTFGATRSLRCFAHSLNLAMKNAIDDTDILVEILGKVKKIVMYFKNPKASYSLKKEQNAEETLRLIQDVPTRWNSTYLMISRFLAILDPVVAALVKNDMSTLLLTTEEVKILNEVVELLKPAEEVTRGLSGEKYITCSQMLLNFQYIQKELMNTTTTTDLGGKVKKILLGKLEDRFHKIEKHPLVFIAAFMDPRFKLKLFPTKISQYETKMKINELLAKHVNDSNSKSTSHQDQRENSQFANEIIPAGVWKYHRELLFKDRQESSRIQEGDIDVKKYLDHPMEEENINPIEYWSKKKQEAPLLSALALKYLTIPATSVPSERLFSGAGRIASALRARISSKHLYQLLFLKSLDLSDWQLN